MKLFKKLMFVLEGGIRGFTTIKQCLNPRKQFDDIFDNKNMRNEFGMRSINIGLGNVAVAAASAVKRPPRCTNKGRKKRRCL